MARTGNATSEQTHQMESDTWDCESIGCNQLILGGVCTCMELQESPISSGRYMGLTPSAESLLLHLSLLQCATAAVLSGADTAGQPTSSDQMSLCHNNIRGRAGRFFQSSVREVAQGIFSTLHCQMENQSQPAMATASLQPKWAAVTLMCCSMQAWALPIPEGRHSLLVGPVKLDLRCVRSLTLKFLRTIRPTDALHVSTSTVTLDLQTHAGIDACPRGLTRLLCIRHHADNKILCSVSCAILNI